MSLEDRLADLENRVSKLEGSKSSAPYHGATHIGLVVKWPGANKFDLPAKVEDPVVYVNGKPVVEHIDFKVDGTELLWMGAKLHIGDEIGVWGVWK